MFGRKRKQFTMLPSSCRFCPCVAVADVRWSNGEEEFLCEHDVAFVVDGMAEINVLTTGVTG